MEIARQTLRPETVTHNCDPRAFSRPPHQPTPAEKTHTQTKCTAREELRGAAHDERCSSAPNPTRERSTAHADATAALQHGAFLHMQMLRRREWHAKRQAGRRRRGLTCTTSTHQNRKTHTHTEPRPPPPPFILLSVLLSLCLFYSLGGKKFLSMNHQLKEKLVGLFLVTRLVKEKREKCRMLTLLQHQNVIIFYGQNEINLSNVFSRGKVHIIIITVIIII